MLDSFTDKIIEIKKLPNMKALVGKGLFLAMLRPNFPKEGQEIQKAVIVLKDIHPDPKKLALFKEVCQYSQDDSYVPATYIQTLFIGLLGKYISSNIFPLNPLRLIHTHQNINQFHQIKIKDSLNLWCGLKKTQKTLHGIELIFELRATHENRITWQGLSTFLIKIPRSTKRKRSSNKKEVYLPVEKTFNVPINITRRYAKASGDYNLHHTSNLFAKMLGFKTTIAHGMWSMAMAVANIESIIPIKYPLEIDNVFKIPVFLPARVSLGYKIIESKNINETKLLFELRDDKKKIPHITGSLKY